MTSASQTSAPVHEYRCLFTHDLHKKQKKWHDGTLKFHTYNSRVMVYDDRQNFVGDLHYRGSELFGEGLDLQLDKPVLVNVEDRLGESNTDLTEVLRQRADPRPTQSSRNSLPQRLSSTAQPKQRSIKDLLVASQGHLGRRALPSRSPFEQRQQQIQGVSIEPPAKRQKVQHDKEQLPPPRPRQETIAPVSATHSSKQQTDIPSDSSRQSPQNSSHEQGVRTATQSRQNKPKPPVQPPQLEPTVERVLPPRATVSLRDDSEAQCRDPTLDRRPLPVPSVGHHRRLTDVSEQRARGARSALIFVTRNPPPRLRYKALLPGFISSPEVRADGSKTEERDASLEKEDVRPKNCAHLLELDRLIESQADTQVGIVLPPEAQDLVQQDEELVEEARPSDKNTPHNTAFTTSGDVTEMLEPEHINIDSSPLFVPYTQTQLSIPPTQPLAKTDFEIPGAEQERSPGMETPLATRDSVQEHTAKVITVERGGKNGPFAADDDDDDYDYDHDGNNEKYEENNADDEYSVDECQPQTSKEVKTPAEICIDNASNDRPKQSDTCNPTREVHKQTELLSDTDSGRSCNSNPNLGDTEMAEQSSHEAALPPDTASLPTTTRVPPFRRVLSESNVNDGDIFNRAKAGSPRKTTMLPPSTSRRSVMLNTAIATVAPVALPRAASDSAVLEELEVSSTAIDAFLAEATQFQTSKHSGEANLHASQQDQDTTEIEDSEQLEEQGPWTSSEAFLLFDWWPPNRVKPDYGQHARSILKDKTSKTKTLTGTKIKTANAATARSAESSLGHSKMGKYSNFSSARLVSQR